MADKNELLSKQFLFIRNEWQNWRFSAATAAAAVAAASANDSLFAHSILSSLDGSALIV